MGKYRRRYRGPGFFAFVRAGALAVLCAGCGGAGGGRTVPQTLDAASSRSIDGEAAPAVATASLNAWPMYGYDTAHDGYNPNTKMFTDASISKLHLAWQFSLGETGTQTQPILATAIGTHKGVLFVGGRNGVSFGVDATTGKSVWSRSFGTEQMQCVNGGPLLTLGAQATSAYDPVGKVVYSVANTNPAPNAPQTITIYKLDPATGDTLASVNITPMDLPGEIDFAHTGLTLANGMLYVGTGSTCDLSSWRGALYAVNVSTMTLANTFYTVFGRGGPYSGGGIWGWGGAAVGGSGNVFIGVGNADINTGKIGPQPPFKTTTNEQVGYGEHLVRLSSDLTTVLGSHAVHYDFSKSVANLDLSGTPVLFSPVGCPSVTAIQGKAGLLNFYESQNVGAGPVGSFQFSVGGDTVAYIGNGAYSPLTGLYYANVPTATGGSIRPPGMVAVGMTGCKTPSIIWSSQFGADSYSIGPHNGQPRSAPTVTAGNVVFVSSPTVDGKSQLWALDATTGTVLNNGNPVLTTAALMRMPPVIDGEWLYVLDQGGDLYALTLKADVPSIKATLTGRQDPISRW
jgi:outer membrane protein assembly factor BamB